MRGGATDDGRSVGLAVTALPGTFGDATKGAPAVMKSVDTRVPRVIAPPTRPRTGQVGR